MSVSIALVVLCLAAQSETPVAVDGARQLFLDDYLIASTENLTRQIHPAKKYPGNPVLPATEPWEQEVAIVYGSVLRDQGKYRIWYYTAGNVGYAESGDGMRWTKPRLGIVQVDGQETNLVIRRGAGEGEPGAIPSFYEIFGVHRDDRDPDPGRRYKMGFLSLDRNYRGPLRFYYGGRTYRHSPYSGNDKGRPGGAVGLATIQRDRFVSLSASFDGGRIVTKPVKLQGERLHLNAKSDFGEIVVEVLDAEGRTLARSKPIQQDALDVPVQWQEGNLQGLESAVTLRITLRNALLFALWCS